MKIIREYNDSGKIDFVEITSASYVADFSILISFNDNAEKLIDFKPFLLKSVHPSISKYLNEELFKQFEIINGNLNWNDYDLMFPVHELYEGEIK